MGKERGGGPLVEGKHGTTNLSGFEGILVAGE